MRDHRAERRRGPLRGLAVVAATIALVSVGAGAVMADSTYDPASDVRSLAGTTSHLGAEAWWDAGYTGAGVDVALIDSGVAPVKGIGDPGKLIYGPDLSFESQIPALTHLDTFGHGTFMAGLIAGRDPEAVAPYSANPASTYLGVAPDARIVSLKVATQDGGTDVSQVIAAIDWVVQHRTDAGLNIRVLNLSYGTFSKQASTVDPLAYAVEQAWKAGIVVVAAAGNNGYQHGSHTTGLANPAYDPAILAVGGSDDAGTATVADDVPGAYTASGHKVRNPDLWTPGSHLQGLRVPGSYIDLTAPGGRLGDRFFRGTGTSEATALTSGIVALLLQKQPSLTPDQVKALLLGTARKMPKYPTQNILMLEPNLTALLAAGAPGPSSQTLTGTGTGTLEAARGEDHLSLGGVVLSGERDIFGAPFVASRMAALEAAGNTWTGGTWNGNTWTGNTWTGNTWNGNTWTGNTWTGNTWTGNTWTGNTWTGNTWTGNTWTGNTWTGNTWTGNTWTGNTWTGNTWTGNTWTGNTWTTDGWQGHTWT